MLIKYKNYCINIDRICFFYVEKCWIYFEDRYSSENDDNLECYSIKCDSNEEAEFVFRNILAHYNQETKVLVLDDYKDMIKMEQNRKLFNED